jgi:hypothetical protein
MHIHRAIAPLRPQSASGTWVKATPCRRRWRGALGLPATQTLFPRLAGCENGDGQSGVGVRKRVRARPGKSSMGMEVLSLGSGPRDGCRLKAPDAAQPPLISVLCDPNRRPCRRPAARSCDRAGIPTRHDTPTPATTGLVALIGVGVLLPIPPQLAMGIAQSAIVRGCGDAAQPSGTIDSRIGTWGVTAIGARTPIHEARHPAGGCWECLEICAMHLVVSCRRHGTSHSPSVSHPTKSRFRNITMAPGD